MADSGTAFDYSFTLHFKGEKKDINLFKKRVKEAIDNDEIYKGKNLYFKGSTISGNREDVGGEVYEPFLPYIGEFPNLLFFCFRYRKPLSGKGKGTVPADPVADLQGTGSKVNPKNPFFISGPAHINGFIQGWFC